MAIQSLMKFLCENQRQAKESQELPSCEDIFKINSKCMQRFKVEFCYCVNIYYPKYCLQMTWAPADRITELKLFLTPRNIYSPCILLLSSKLFSSIYLLLLNLGRRKRKHSSKQQQKCCCVVFIIVYDYYVIPCVSQET